MGFVLMFIILLWYCHVEFALTLCLTHLALILSNPTYLILIHFNFLLTFFY